MQDRIPFSSEILKLSHQSIQFSHKTGYKSEGRGAVLFYSILVRISIRFSVFGLQLNSRQSQILYFIHYVYIVVLPLQAIDASVYGRQYSLKYSIISIRIQTGTHSENIAHFLKIFYKNTEIALPLQKKKIKKYIVLCDIRDVLFYIL